MHDDFDGGDGERTQVGVFIHQGTHHGGTTGGIRLLFKDSLQVFLRDEPTLGFLQISAETEAGAFFDGGEHEYE